MTDDVADRGCKVTGVELLRVMLPLVSPFRTSFGTETVRDALLVRAITPEGDGWGECVAMAAPLYSSEYVDAAEHVIQHHMLPRLFALETVSAEAVAPALAAIAGHRMAKASLEMAILDAQLRSRSESFGSYLGATRERIDCGVSVGIMSSLENLLEAVGQYLEKGYRRIKLKIEPAWDVAPVRAVRERFGDDILLQVDANAAYSMADLPALQELDAFDLLLIEQPFAEDEMRMHAELAKLIRTPVCLDESITSARAAEEAISMGACSVVNIKPGRVGGYLEARRIHDTCARLGVPVWCGGMLETGLGRAANIALAALPQFALPADISASERYFHRDITPPFEMVEGRLRVPTGPGLGVEPIPAILGEALTSRSYVSRT